MQKSEKTGRAGKRNLQTQGGEEKVRQKPLLVEIEAKAGEDESEERHQNGDGH